MRIHSGCAVGSDLLFVCKDAAVGPLAGLALHHRNQRCVGAHAVVLAVAENQSLVETDVAGLACGNQLELCRCEVLFLDSVLLLEELENLVLSVARGILVLLGILVVLHVGITGQNGIELFCLDEVGCGFLHLLLGDVRQDVGDAEDGILGVVSDSDLDFGAVGLEDHAVDCKRACDPLVFLDSAVVVRVQIHDAGLVELILIDGVLLGIESG